VKSQVPAVRRKKPGGWGLSLLAAAGNAFLSLLFATTRVRRVGSENYERHRRRSRPVIFVFWHANLLPLVHLHRDEGITVLVSTHRDGELIAKVIQKRGFGLARGSSSRGGVTGLRALVWAARKGRDLAVTPDGPRGPRESFKVGALMAARLSGLPVVPIALRFSDAWQAPSWDGFVVPHPFSAIRVEYLPAWSVARDADRAALDSIAREIEGQLKEREGK